MFFTTALLSALALGATAQPIVQKPRQNTVPVGTVITSCTVPNTIAITFDDGPFTFTQSVLDQLNAANMKGTFFMNGNNFGSIYDYPDVIKNAVNGGHQLGSHTWSHADLATLSADQVRSEMTQLETAFLSIIGKFPNYLRPPYLSTSPDSLSVLSELGYKVISVDIDTKDYENLENIDASLENFRAGLDAGGSISLEHDVHQTTAEGVVPGIIEEVQARGLQAVTVGECLGEDSSLWYATGR